jgi:C4-dicarboxylate-specific signal transduction histidine kinase
MTAKRDRVVRHLNRHSWLLLGLIAGLLLLDRLLVQPGLLRVMDDAAAINVAGRQRMLSQRLAKAALASERSQGTTRVAYRAELGQVLAQWEAAHARLTLDAASGRGPGRDGTAIKRTFRDLEPFRRRIGEAARKVLADDPEAGLTGLLEAEPGYLERMDRIVGLYEGETRTRVADLLRAGWGVTTTSLAALLGIGLAVLRPTTRLLREKFQELREARDELEARVRQRTEDLEQLNRDLESQARERAEADARHRALLAQFGQIARVNTIGELATNLAHELNQPLGAIANYAGGCLVALDAPGCDPARLRGPLEQILATTLRAGEIIRRTRRFVTRRAPVRERFDPNSIVGQVLALLASDIERHRIQLDLALAPGLPYMEGDPVQIQQVLVNLIRNAIDSVSATQTPTSLIVVKTGIDAAGLLEYRVEDNGEGIPEDRIGAIFDPFFSTRADGMGMGLAISRTIVEAHQGRIVCESEPGLRTTFRVLLPPASTD